MTVAGAASAPVSGPVQLALFGPAAAAEVPTRPAPLAVDERRPAPAAPSSRGGWVQRWYVRSATHRAVVYVVAQRADGQMGCQRAPADLQTHRGGPGAGRREAA